MRLMPSNPDLTPEAETSRSGPQGSQTLLRGLDMLDHVIDGPVPLAELSQRIGLTRATTHRLASALIDRGFLTLVPRAGYQLGPKLLYLGFLAQSRVDLVRAARPHIEELAGRTEDTVHLGRRDEDSALYLDKIPGRRRVEISSRIGDRQPLTSTGLGKALLLDSTDAEWRRLGEHDRAAGGPGVEPAVWELRMRGYVGSGIAFDLEENEDQIRCVAAPIRDASGEIVAAISVSSAAQYMSDQRMTELSADVRAAAAAISADLGFNTAEPATLKRRPR